jgi:DNA-binding CsgD family transcriptional regulator
LRSARHREETRETSAMSDELSAFSEELSASVSERRSGNITLDSITDEIALYKFLSEAKDVTAFLRRIHTLVHRAGFSDFSYMYLEVIEDSLDSIGTYPEQNKLLYNSEEFYKYDLLLQHALLSEKPILQTQVNLFVDSSPVENELLDRNKAIYRLMQSVGMNEYYNIPFRAHAGNGKALFSVTTQGAAPLEVQRRVDRHRPALDILARAVDQIGSQRFDTHFHRPKTRRQAIINAKPLALLDMLANHNITLNEAAERLHISISTANQQIAAAKRALGANTTAAAIIQALKLGLIRIEK